MLTRKVKSSLVVRCEMVPKRVKRKRKMCSTAGNQKRTLLWTRTIRRLSANANT